MAGLCRGKFQVACLFGDFLVAFISFRSLGENYQYILSHGLLIFIFYCFFFFLIKPPLFFFFLIFIRNSSMDMLGFFTEEAGLILFWIRKRGCASHSWSGNGYKHPLWQASLTILRQLQVTFFSSQIAGLKLLKRCRSYLP